MHNLDDDQAQAAADQDAKHDDQLKAFAGALGRELDRIGYPAAPARTNQLSHDLGLGRMQAYRIGRGDNMPTLKALVKLQSLGVSFDTVLAGLHTTTAEDEIAVEILGTTVKAVVLPAHAWSPFAASMDGGKRVLRTLQPGEQLGAGDVPVGGLRFTRPLPVVAVVEDDPATLAVLAKQIEQSFRVSQFSVGRALLVDAARLTAFDALVIDWRLPDIDGATLVNLIRAQTLAPIVVTTGERREAQAISAILHLPNIRYVGKPVDGDILRATIEAAIAESGVVAGSLAVPTKAAQPTE